MWSMKGARADTRNERRRDKRQETEPALLQQYDALIGLFTMGILEGIIGPLLQKYLGAYFEGTWLFASYARALS